MNRPDPILSAHAGKTESVAQQAGRDIREVAQPCARLYLAGRGGIMLTFYLIAGAVAVVCMALIVRPLVSGPGEAQDAAASDTQVFKDQLAEIERDLTRGTIQPAEAEGARIEVSRRLLAAAQRADARNSIRPAPQGISGMVAGLSLIGVPALAAALYLGLGAPGYQDIPLAGRTTAGQSVATGQPAPNRMTQAEAEAEVAGNLPPAPDASDDEEYRTLVAQLEQTIAERPDDAQGHQLLANGLMRLGRWSEAAATYKRLIDILGPGATADMHATRAEALVLAAAGYVSPEAETEIRRALEIAPSLPIGRYYAGLALRQAGRLDDAITVWEGLRRDSPADAPYLEWLNMMLAETVQARGGPSIPGPNQADMAAANDMSPEDRNDMIEGMVARLAARLDEQGGSPDEWAQLISSYAVLDQQPKAMAALEQALAAYPTGPAANMLAQRGVELQLIESPSTVANAGTSVPATPGPTTAGTTTPGTTPPGPTAEDIEAASQMTAADRSDMISGMVARLEGRLTSDGGSAEEWLRLINAYVQLDRKDDAARIYQLAEVALAQDPSRGFVKEQTLLLGIPVE